MNDADWKKVSIEIRQRWPDWQPTDGEREDLKRALKGQVYGDVFEGIYRVRCEPKASTKVPSLALLIDKTRLAKNDRVREILDETHARTKQESTAEEMRVTSECASMRNDLLLADRATVIEARDSILAGREVHLIEDHHRHDEIERWPGGVIGVVWAKLEQDHPQMVGTGEVEIENTVERMYADGRPAKTIETWKRRVEASLFDQETTDEQKAEVGPREA